MDIVGISVCDFGQESEMCLGLPFGRCLMVKKDSVWAEFEREEIEEEMDRFCLVLLLPVEDNAKELVNEGRTKNCAIVFDDWDIMNKLGVKGRIDLCGILFGT